MLILYYLGLVIAFVLLIVPGIWLYAAWGVATPALLIERLNPFRALGRSRRLVKGCWWATAGVILVSALMVAILTSIVSGILTAIALTSNPSLVFAVIISLLSGVVAGLIVQPFQATVVTVLYYELRVRHEGY